MCLEKICHEESDSCYTCDNRVEEGDKIVCPSEHLILNFKDCNEEEAVNHYRKAVRISKGCSKFKKISLFED